MPRSADTRFAVIEDAAALLAMLPPAGEIAWPADKGDLEAVDDALAVISVRLRQIKASRREHRQRMRSAAMNGGGHAHPR